MRIFNWIVVMALVTLGIAAQANATIIISSSPSFVQPEENLLLRGTGLTTTGNPVQGQTNQTATVFNITGSEELTLPSNGQARIESATANTPYTWATFDAADPLLYFTLFEANVNVTGTPIITVGAMESNGETTLYTYTGGTGENFFGVKAIDGQLIDFIKVSTEPDESIEDIAQIRVGGISDIGGNPVPSAVPEPTSMLLLGTGLCAIGFAVCRRKK